MRDAAFGLRSPSRAAFGSAVLTYGASAVTVWLHRAEGARERGEPLLLLHWLRDATLALPLVAVMAFLAVRAVAPTLARLRGTRLRVAALALVAGTAAAAALALGGPFHERVFHAEAQTLHGHGLAIAGPPLAAHLVKDFLAALPAAVAVAALLAWHLLRPADGSGPSAIEAADGEGAHEISPGAVSRRRFLGYGVSAAGVTAVSLGGFELFDRATSAAGAAEPADEWPMPGPKRIELFVNEGEMLVADGTSLYVLGYGSTASDLNVDRVPLKAVEGDELTVVVSNRLREPHAFVIDGVVDSGAIPPGGTRTLRFTAPPAGAYIYHDPLRRGGVNRLLGLNGVLVTVLASGSRAPFRGGPTPVNRHQFTWVFQGWDAEWAELARRGRADDIEASSFQPRYFTINGKSGLESARAKDVHVEGHVGETTLIRLVNVGGVTNSPHFHGNHVEVHRADNRRQDIVMVKDIVRLDPMTVKEVILPIERPGDAVQLVTTKQEYPMHCHAEPSQTAGGGLYPNGMLADWTFLGGA